MSLEIIVLAAGRGTRMHSDVPKVLHNLAGKPLLAIILDTAQQLQPRAIHVVHGYEGEIVKERLSSYPVNWVHQAQQLGTGHAVLTALPNIASESQVLVLFGDVPLISVATLQNLLTITQRQLGLLTANFADPFGLGRVVRDMQGTVIDIVEERDADQATRNITEIFCGILAAPAHMLQQWLPSLTNDNAQQEYYLPQLVKLATAEQFPIVSSLLENTFEVQGVNDRAQLQQVERCYQALYAAKLMQQGVSIMDAQRLDVRGELTVGRDVVIDVNVIFEGNNQLGDGCYIGANCIIKDSIIAENVRVEANSIIEHSQIQQGCNIGPFARLRPGTNLAAQAKIGNFVETKKMQLGEHSKINHLSYVGDATIGNNVNIGAGTITCNYDGFKKHQTVIADNVFVGSDTQLIAPVTIGEDATIGAGATIRKDVPAHALAHNDTRQTENLNWQRPQPEFSED